MRYWNRLLILPLIFAGATHVSAQVVDSTDAVQAGTAAADLEPLGPYGAFSFVGGAAFGFGALNLFGEGSTTEKITTAAGFAAVLITSSRAAAASKKIPAHVQARIASKDAQYQAAFRQSYSKQLNYRRQKIVFGAAVVGGVVGFAALGLLWGAGS